MFSIERSFSLISSHKKELCGLGFAVIAAIAGIALFSFHPHDPSPFYFSSEQLVVQNWCGVVGASIAAFLYFLCGSVSFVLVTLLAYFGYWLCTGGSWKSEWERIIAGMLLIISLATLSTLHHLELQPFHYYGGYIGFLMSAFLFRMLDAIGSFIIAYTALYASLVILIRFSFISSVHMIWQGAISAYHFCQRHQIVQRIYALAKGIASTAYRVVSWCIRLGAPRSEPEPMQPFAFQKPYMQPIGQQESNAVTPETPLHADHPDQEQIEEERHISFMPNDYQQQQKEPMPEVPSRPYGLPDLNIFIGIKERQEDDRYKKELEQRAHILEQKLEHFGVYGNVISIKNGPIVTLFEYQPNIDTKISKILALEDDLALALQAHSIRILAPIPGRSVVGFEVSNYERKEVLFAHAIQSPEYEQFEGILPLILGKDTVGNNVVADLTKMPHLLIAGSTGSGKSVALNAMLMSLLCKCKPDELRLILIDPKRLEFAPYADVAHLLFPIITEPKRSIPVLRWVVQQMDERYEKMAEYGVRNIFDYNTIAKERGQEEFPFIVVVIDELSDLMLTVGREIEDLITRVAQMARAAGIHMIVATQRPSVDVITGLIKVNFPSRISFRVTSKVDSRTILDCGGADKLLGRGDMLFLDSTASILKRIHGAYVSDEQIAMVTSHIRSQRPVQYLDISQTAELDDDVSAEDEDLLNQVVSFLDEVEEVSISLLQRKFRIGYNRSARIIDMLESRGLIMPADGSKTRRVIR